MEHSRRLFLQALAATAAVRPLAAQPGDPLGVRPEFPAAADRLYLNSAYIAPVPRAVAAAGRAFVDAKMERPISLGEMQRAADRVRAQYAALIGASPDEIAFLYSTSEGENIVARGLGLKKGDNVVVDELHYNTTFVLYRELERTLGIELRIVKARDGAVDASDFARHVDRRTRLVSVAWVSHQNGFRHDMRPIADLAHAHGAFFYVDGVQAVGMFPIDIGAAGVDFMAAGTYKWLLASFGVAPFFIRRDLLDRIPLDRFGALHVERELGDFRYEIYRTAKRFDYATPAFGPIYQLGAALAFLERVGVAAIETHTVALADRLNRGLRDMGARVVTPLGNRSSIVSFSVDPARDPAGYFTKAGVDVSIRESGRQVRVSPALFNTVDDIDRFLALSRDIVRG
ncbi:MAG: aminotransferase class V-fold PLP-dependent enzyme [Acidobacteria bacterium]|nr:aminotransferase class V-fold PLP-dependent enzyme [Acidobacteriota bacterium]